MPAPLNATVQVTAPSRLHFGMFSWGRPDVRQFGGVGAMIDQPGIELVCRRAEQWTATGPLAQRVLAFADSWRKHYQPPDDWACALEVLQSPPEHAGLGVGTQLGMAVSAALSTLWQGEPLCVGLRPPAGNAQLVEWATAAKRGKRSAVGLYGFGYGGLIVEAGKTSAESISPLIAQIPLPKAWRFVMFQPETTVGRSGTAEQQAFSDLPPPELEQTNQLCRMALLELLPAAQSENFIQFSDALYRFGHLAGELFAPFQGGPYASAELTRWVTQLRAWRISGVGQSSWGPTLFALVPSESSARSLLQMLPPSTHPIMAAPSQGCRSNLIVHASRA